MRGEQMAVTYIVVLGFEAITALTLSIAPLKESGSVSKFAGVVLVLAGLSFFGPGSRGDTKPSQKERS